MSLEHEDLNNRYVDANGFVRPPTDVPKPETLVPAIDEYQTLSRTTVQEAFHQLMTKMVGGLGSVSYYPGPAAEAVRRALEHESESRTKAQTAIYQHNLGLVHRSDYR